MNNKILIADSNYLLREGLKSLIANSEYQLVGEVNSGTELFEAVSLTQPHLVIINFTSINFSVNDISKIVAANSSTQILAITERPTKQAVSKAMQAGVKSYLMIDCTTLGVKETRWWNINQFYLKKNKFPKLS